MFSQAWEMNVGFGEQGTEPGISLILRESVESLDGKICLNLLLGFQNTLRFLALFSIFLSLLQYNKSMEPLIKYIIES